MIQSPFRVFYIDGSAPSNKGILMTIDGASAVIPRPDDYVKINDESFVVTHIIHSFVENSKTHVIEVHTINGFEYSMRK